MRVYPTAAAILFVITGSASAFECRFPHAPQANFAGADLKYHLKDGTPVEYRGSVGTDMPGTVYIAERDGAAWTYQTSEKKGSRWPAIVRIGSKTFTGSCR